MKTELVWVFEPRHTKGHIPKLHSHWREPCEALASWGGYTMPGTEIPVRLPDTVGTQEAPEAGSVAPCPAVVREGSLIYASPMPRLSMPLRMRNISGNVGNNEWFSRG